MDAVQRKALALMRELHDAFERAGIAYCLADKAAWDCWTSGAFAGGYHQVCLIVSEEQMDAIANMPLKNGRELVSDARTHLNPDAFRYVDSTTTLVPVDLPRTTGFGICVELLPVRKDGSGFAVPSGHGATLVLETNPLEQRTLGLLEGTRFFLPGDPQSYFKALLGKNWQKKYDKPYGTNKYGTVAEPNVPYREYVRDAMAAGAFDPATTAQAADELYAWRRDELARTADDVEGLFDRYRFLAARFKMCEKYLPYKEQLIAAWAAGRKDEVALALKDYTDRMKHFAEGGRALYFDEELFRLAVKALIHSGKRRAVTYPFMVDRAHRKSKLAHAMAPYLENGNSTDAVLREQS